MASSGWNDMRGDIQYAGQRAAQASAEAAETITRAVQESTREVVAAQESTTRAVEQNTAVIGEGLQRLEEHARELAALTSQGFCEVARSLDLQSSHLASVEYMQANPFKTGAAELFREGLEALKNGWNEEAAERFVHSLEKDPLNPATRAAHAYALAAQGHTDRAFSEFGLAVRYSAKHPSNASLAAASAQSMAALGGPDRRQDVLDGLEAALKLAPTCAELHLTRAHLTGSKTDMLKAFTLAPELSIPAAEAGLQDCDEVAELVYRDAEGPVRQWFALGGLLNDLPPLRPTHAMVVPSDDARTLERAVDETPTKVTFAPPTDRATAMTLHGRWTAIESADWMSLARHHLQASAEAEEEAATLTREAESATETAATSSMRVREVASEKSALAGRAGFWLGPVVYGLLALLLLSQGGVGLVVGLVPAYLCIKQSRKALKASGSVRRSNQSIANRHKADLASAHAESARLDQIAADAHLRAQQAQARSAQLAAHAAIARQALTLFAAASPTRVRPLAGL